MSFCAQLLQHYQLLKKDVKNIRLYKNFFFSFFLRLKKFSRHAFLFLDLSWWSPTDYWKVRNENVFPHRSFFLPEKIFSQKCAFPFFISHALEMKSLQALFGVCDTRSLLFCIINLFSFRVKEYALCYLLCNRNVNF